LLLAALVAPQDLYFVFSGKRIQTTGNSQRLHDVEVPVHDVLTGARHLTEHINLVAVHADHSNGNDGIRNVLRTLTDYRGLHLCSGVTGGLYFTESSEEDSVLLVLGGLFEALEAAPGPIYAPAGVPSFLCSPGPPPPGLPCFGGAGNPLNFAFFVDLTFSSRKEYTQQICEVIQDFDIGWTCLTRCADVDLARWLGESYRIPAVEQDDGVSGRNGEDED